MSTTLPGDLAERVAAREWYHTVELAPGVVTPGWFDLRGVVARLPLPASLAGARCLDVGTFEGFWALEMERRGAEEVLGVDILDPLAWDWPAGSDDATVRALEDRKDAGHGFELVREALGSSISRRELSVYDLGPENVGEFDFVYLGSLLLHLRDPVGALARVRSVCRGRLLLVDAIDLPMSLLAPRRPLAALDAVGRPWWWKPNRAALVRMVEAAGFRLAAPPRLVALPAGPAYPRAGGLAGLTRLRHRTARELLWASRFGSPHLALLAEPIR